MLLNKFASISTFTIRPIKDRLERIILIDGDALIEISDEELKRIGKLTEQFETEMQHLQRKWKHAPVQIHRKDMKWLRSIQMMRQIIEENEDQTLNTKKE